MENLIRGIIILLAFISCTQILGLIFPYYNLMDELLLGVLILLLVFQKPNRINFNKVFLILILLLYFTINFIINYYSLPAFFIKLIYYTKSITPFLVVSYYCKKYIKLKQLKIIYWFLLISASFSIVEFLILQYVDIWSFGHSWPFKLRNGLYRAMSLTGHPISLGILDFMGILIGNEVLKTKRKYLLVFALSLILTGSRIPILFLLLYILYYLRNYRIKLIFNRFFYFKKLYMLSIPLSFALIFFIPIYFKEVNETSTTRLIAIEKGIKLFKNPKNIFLGTGIGSFGTYESVVYDSYVYNKIDFPNDYKDVIMKNKATGIETFFFMSLIEMGLIGFVLYYALILNLFQKQISEFKVFMIIIVLLYTLAYPLYTFPFVFLINIYFPELVNYRYKS